MPKNTRGGKKHKRGKRHNQGDVNPGQVPVAEAGQTYARVIKRLGGSRLQVMCSDGQKRSAIIRGKFRKRVWMNPDDLLLGHVENSANGEVFNISMKYNIAQERIMVAKGLVTPRESTEFHEGPEDDESSDEEDQHPKIAPQRRILDLDEIDKLDDDFDLLDEADEADDEDDGNTDEDTD